MNDIPQERLQDLFNKYLTSQFTEAEEIEFFEWCLKPGNEDAMNGLLEKYWEEVTPEENVSAEKATALVNNIIQSSNSQVVSINRKKIRGWLAIAASVVLLISFGMYWWNILQTVEPAPVTKVTPSNIQPGTDGAILTLADGSKVVLDSLNNGIIAVQNGTKVSLSGHGLTYAPEAVANERQVYNTIITPHSRQFHVVLPDGSNIWLNAGSSVKFPTVFIGNTRTVEIAGEVYFEVKHDQKKPFIVQIHERNAKIEVLGTTFNVNAYNNEEVLSTTLIKGSVRVNNTTIKPGQQALVENDQATTPNVQVIDKANVDQAIAWKNGAFNFEGASIGEVLRQLERWYDIKVEYRNANNALKFRGGFYRNVSFADVLDVLKEMGVKYELKGKTLIVL